MNRRTAIKRVLVISAGVGLLPSCLQQEKKIAGLKNISITAEEEKLLVALTDAIIPETENFIGAKSLKSHAFVIIMIDDCSSPEEQNNFKAGLKAFDKLSHQKFGQLFTGNTAEQKKSLLYDIENNNEVPEDAIAFYKTVKQFTVQSFTSSKEYMTSIKHYKMVPGSNFKGCVKI